MYNFYTYERRKKEKEHKEKNEIKEKQLKAHQGIISIIKKKYCLN